MGIRGNAMEPASKIESIKIKGFRSLADVELTDLPNAAVLIGPNGSGKSNVFLFLEMLRQMLRYRRLGEFVARHGGADDQLFGGSEQTPRIESEIGLKAKRSRGTYVINLSYTQGDGFFVDRESIDFSSPEPLAPMGRIIFNRDSESGILPFDSDGEPSNETGSPHLDEALIECRDFLGGWSFHQFHNTGFHSDIKKSWDVTDSARLLPDGGNLAAVLYGLEREDPKRYDYICNLVNRILPTFDRFDLEESYGKVMLRWKARDSDKTMGAHLTSDGSLRYFCLVTLLNLPEEMLPSVILLDEPELGLHPSAVGLIGAMIKRMSRKRQVIVATQSPLLVDEFAPNEIFVTELKEGRTIITRQNEEYLSVWLEEFSIGELWQKNVLGGHP